MTSSLNKKNYNLQTYNKALAPLSSAPLAFFLSRFGGRLPHRISSVLSIKSCKVSLIRKILRNDIFSGPTYFIFPTPYEDAKQVTDFGFLKMFGDVRSFSLSATNTRLQSVLLLGYVINYPFFEFLVRPLPGLAESLMRLKFFGALVPFIFFAVRLFVFLRFILNQNLTIFNALGLLRKPNIAFV